jgi:small subunit ribosomal protein S3
MGQKVHPIGFRVGITRNWESVWFAQKSDYTKYLHEDLQIRNFLKEKWKEAQISKIEIRRRWDGGEIEIEIHAAKPGVIYGRKSKGLEILRDEVKKFTQSEPRFFIIQVRKADIQAQLVAESIAQQLEKRVSFRRAMKKAIQQAMRPDSGALGIKVSCSGRLGGADMARCEWFREGRVPLHTLRADVDYGTCGALTTYGVTGVKVWIYKGEFGTSEDE